MVAPPGMRPRTLVILAVIAAALGALLIIDARVRSTGGDQHAAAGARVLPAFDRKAIQQISIQRQQGEAFALVHAPSPNTPTPAPAWRVETPKLPAADDVVIEDLLAALDLAESERIVEISPAAAGLQPPVAEVALQTTLQVREAKDVITLQLGRPDAAGQGVYARAGTTGPIRVVGRRLLELVNRDPTAFRDRRLLPIDPTTVTAIEWAYFTHKGELRAVDGRWQNERKEWVDEGRVVEALRRLFALRIDLFDISRSRSVAFPKELTVVAGATRIALVFVDGGSAAGEVTRGGEDMYVPHDALAAAFQALMAAGARDNRLIAMAPDAVTRIDLFDDDGRVGLLRGANGAWAFSTPKLDYTADSVAVDAWLMRLGRITVPTRAEGPKTRHLILEGRFRQEVAVSAPPDVFALLTPDPLRFRERELLAVARFDVRRLQRTSGKDVQQLTSDDGTTWRSPSGADVDTANAARVASALADLRAESFVVAAPPGEPAVRLEVDVQAPGEAKAARHTLQIWPTCIARFGTDATFTMERARCDALRLDLLKKSG